MYVEGGAGGVSFTILYISIAQVRDVKSSHVKQSMKWREKNILLHNKQLISLLFTSRHTRKILQRTLLILLRVLRDLGNFLNHLYSKNIVSAVQKIPDFPFSPSGSLTVSLASTVANGIWAMTTRFGILSCILYDTQASV